MWQITTCSRCPFSKCAAGRGAGPQSGGLHERDFVFSKAAHRNGGRGRTLRQHGRNCFTVIGDYFDNEVSVFTQRLLSMLEPAITIVLAVVTVILLLAVYLPMFTMYGSIV